MDERSI
ncbi:unnamed protein product [Cuscuta epithymum]|nr:unnamed protein product [Cuscuta epithymum]